jgi:SAM-dependent methyltransferase
MKKDEYQRLQDIEDTNWWYGHRRRTVKGFAQRYAPDPQTARLLSLACATGSDYRHYREFGSVYGVDIASESMALCQACGFERVALADGVDIPMGANRFDMITALDSFEHFEDHERAFQESYRVLKPGGILIMNVPAFQALWSYHDVAFQHFRRYRPGEVKSLLRAAGFEVEFAGCIFIAIAPLVFLFRKFRQSQTTVGQERSDFFLDLPIWLEALLKGWHRLERLTLPWLSAPVGTSVFAVARKPEKAG